MQHRHRCLAFQYACLPPCRAQRQAWTWYGEVVFSAAAESIADFYLHRPSFFTGKPSLTFSILSCVPGAARARPSFSSSSSFYR